MPAMEGTPEEKEPISDEQCLEAMKAVNFEVVRAWYAAQERIADASPDQRARLDFQLRYAKVQLDSGLIDEDSGESFAFPTLEALRDTYPAQGDEEAHRIQAIIDQMRGK